jgi:hypothetical protein
VRGLISPSMGSARIITNLVPVPLGVLPSAVSEPATDYRDWPGGGGFICPLSSFVGAKPGSSCEPLNRMGDHPVLFCLPRSGTYIVKTGRVNPSSE